MVPATSTHGLFKSIIAKEPKNIHSNSTAQPHGVTKRRPKADPARTRNETLRFLHAFPIPPSLVAIQKIPNKNNTKR
jgi:hypothetical protein